MELMERGIFCWKSSEGPNNCPKLCVSPIRLLHISALQMGTAAGSRAEFLNS